MNAIITAAAGYTEADLQMFLHSVERNCRKTKVFLIVYKHDQRHVESLRQKYECLEFVYVPKKSRRGFKYHRSIARYLSAKDYSSINPVLEMIGRYPLHVAIERYFVALKVVQAYHNSFSSFLLTDSRDVIIQKDPFRLIGRRLVSGIEPKNIGDCPINSGWIKEIYGEDVLSQMSKMPIVCAGVTLGPAKEVETYLTEMCRKIWRCLPKLTLTPGFDQGIHNHLIFENKITFDLTANQEGFIATLTYEKPSNMLKVPTTGLLHVHDVSPAIVHQYDRHPDLVDFFKESFASQQS